MAHIHPSAILSGDVQLAEDVVVGPYSILAGRIRVGPGTQLVSHVQLQGPLEMGEANVCYPGVCLGFAPQDVSFDAGSEGAGISIGSRNVFREHVTIHRATRADRPTRVGDRNYWMINSHAGHDVQVGSDCVFANSTLLAGHVEVGDRVVCGGHATLHQFVRLGRGSLISGLTGISGDLCPFFTVTGLNFAGGINVIGMRRAGMARSEIDAVRWCYRVLCRSDQPPKLCVPVLRERIEEPIVREIVEFIESAKRHVITRRGRGVREGSPRTEEE